jgi:hypothetical protein
MSFYRRLFVCPSLLDVYTLLVRLFVSLLLLASVGAGFMPTRS